jgi:flagellar M-ring protein FliF
MSFLQKIQAIWRNIGLVQRVLLVAIVLVLVGGAGLLVHWARQPHMRMLYQQLDPEEAAKITEKISEKGIPYELRHGGTDIYVPEQKVYQLRLDMARAGLPIGENGGYKIFDNEKIGVSPFVQNVNLKRALQEELAKSIKMIDGVVHARVHIVSAEKRLFSSQTEQTSASVILLLRPGFKLSSLNIAAITHLVAGSVEGLKSDSVTVIDGQGHLLSRESDEALDNGAGTVQDYRERVEQNLSQKVEDMLTAVLGAGRATVKVSAVIDMNSVSTITETYQPKGVASKEEIKIESETGTEGTAADAKQSAPGREKKGETTTTEYEVGKTVKQEVILPGKITSLKVAAFVDLSPEAPSDANEAGAGTAKIMELADVQEIIKNALGLEDTTAIKVVDVRFNRPFESLIDERPSNWPRYIAAARQASLGLMAICALLFVKILRGPKKKKARSGAKVAELPEGEGRAGLPAAPEESKEPLVLRRHIAAALQENPEQVRQLFANWVAEKGD